MRKGCKGSFAWVHLAFLLTQVLGTNSCPPWPRYSGCLKKASNKMLLNRAGQTRATQLRRSEPSKDLVSQWAPERAREREARVGQSEPERAREIQNKSESQWQNKPEIEPEKVRVNQSEPETQTDETSCRKKFLVFEYYLFCLFLTKSGSWTNLAPQHSILLRIYGLQQRSVSNFFGHPAGIKFKV